MPVITIVTVVFNALENLKLTAESVFKQTAWPDIEYIIVDGGSTDGTLAYLKTLPPVVRWISEPDKGIYDAMNKGIRMASGEGLLFLNAGDYFVGDVITADLTAPCFLPVKYQHPVLGYRPIRLKKRSEGLPNCHQGIVFERKKELFYDLRYRISSDLDYYIRHGYGDRLPFHACSGFVHFDNSGANQKQAVLRDREIVEIIRKYFGFLPASRFHLFALVKRLVRPMLVFVFEGKKSR
ncbi:glycosyltransferase [Leptonema illini]|uniref:Glycosyl transferase family 2 n=1 Tax=Leptonema illini DSM 21528 TaxID=929563 RepID=H2CD39_9LEPT|nr:glycosyltransferase [Leptonema illini]EHQ07515.1 glycosyl transferase family 2 [Leptonema illini DSM 21528]